MEYYIYAYCDPRKPGRYCYPGLKICFLFEPFYIGIGKGSRIKRHLNKSSLSAKYNLFKNRKLKKIINFGYNPLEYTIILSKEMSRENAEIGETELIMCIGRRDKKLGPLTNLTDGGDGWTGAVSPWKGRSYEEIFGKEKAEELKEEKSKRFQGEKNPMYGKTPWSFGKRLSKQYREKISVARRRRVKQIKDEVVIKVWDCPESASKSLCIGLSSIHNCLSPNQPSKSAGGFKWEYVDIENIKYK